MLQEYIRENISITLLIHPLVDQYAQVLSVLLLAWTPDIW